MKLTDAVDVETVRMCLHTGQKSTRKDAAQVAFARLVEKFEADAQALADVRTLDDWQSLRGRQVEQWTHDPLTYVELRERNGDKLTAHVVVFAETPDEARAKAAAWVREQKPLVAEDKTAFRWPVLCLKCGHPESHGVHGEPVRGRHEFEDPNE